MPEHGKYPPLTSEIYKNKDGKCLFEAIPPVADRALTGEDKDEILERVFSGFGKERQKDIFEYLLENKDNPEARLSDLKFEFLTTLQKKTAVNIPQFFPISSNVDSPIKSEIEKMSRHSVILRFVHPISVFLLACLFGFLLPYMLQGSMDTTAALQATYFTISDALSADIAGTTASVLPDSWIPISTLVVCLLLIVLAVIVVLILILAAQHIHSTDLPHIEEKIRELTKNWKETSSNISMEKMAENGQIAQFVFESKRLMSLRRFFARRSKWLPRFAYPIIFVAVIGVGSLGLGVLYFAGWATGWYIAWGATLLTSVVSSVRSVRWWCDQIEIIRWKYTTNIDPSPTLTCAFLSAIDFIHSNQKKV